MTISTDTKPSDPETPLEPSTATAPEPARTPSRPRAKKPSSGIRHNVELTLRISAMNESTRALLATAIGCNSNAVVDLAVDTLSHESDARAVLTSVNDICTADPMEAGILATVLASENKAIFKSAWRILVLLPSDLTTAAVPAGSANAGLAFAKAAQSLDEPSRKAVARLLKDLGE
jgi:hypothetical protein